MNIANELQWRARIAHTTPWVQDELAQHRSIVVSIRKATRSTAQNSRMWAMLTDIAEQVEWHGQRLPKEAWKDMITAALKRQQVVPGIDGGFVVIGARTREMTVAEMSDVIAFAEAFGAERGVRFRAHD